jgi:hypothetical protein
MLIQTQPAKERLIYHATQTPVRQIQAADKEEFLYECAIDLKYYAKAFMPHRFYRPFPAVYDAIFEVLHEPLIQKVVICSFRGGGKSSILNVLYASHQINFGMRHMISLAGQSATSATRESEDLKFEMSTNKMMNDFFGAPQDTYLDDEALESGGFTFSKMTWIAKGNTMVLPRGAGQQFRGGRFKQHRYDLIMPDDLEESATIDNPLIREQRRHWFFTDLYRAVDQFDSAPRS